MRRNKVETLNDPEAWYNQCCEHVSCCFDESCFDVFYSNTMGRTNASARTLLSMMAFKEGFRWSDRQLYQQIAFNLLVRWACGFENLDDTPLVPSTHYILNKRYTRIT